jgi:cellobiose phosphorylase
VTYGYFDDANLEYVITRPDTPLPWINYLGTDDFFGFVSNAAGGSSFYRDSRLRRLIRYRHNNAPFDVGGRYLYVRDDGDGAYWSPSWQPTRQPLDSYECRHGLSYTRIASSARLVSADILYFVPPGENCEVWRVRLRNERDRPCELSLFSCVEFCLWDAEDDVTNFQRNFSIAEVEVADGVIYHKTEYRERRNHFAYFACSLPLAGFDTQRESFLGPYRGFDAPIAVEAGRASNSIAHGWAPIGSHHLRLALAPGESEELVFLLGYAENPPGQKFDPPESTSLSKAGVRPVLEHWLDPVAAEDGFSGLKGGWRELLSSLQVDTPDLDTNRMVNIWTPYQCMVTFNVSRSISFYESGISRGMGFRDCNQDLLGFVSIVPDRARARLLDLAATQLSNGGAYHQYQPLTKRGNDKIGSGFNDDPLWLVLAVGAYLKESGDFSVLDEQITYDNEPGSEEALFDHLRRAAGYTLDRLGPHGLPLIGRADWNDCLNLNCFSETAGESFQTTVNREGGVAESVFIAGQLVLAARELAAIARRTGRVEQAEVYERHAREMESSILEHAWDGDWFLRAFDYYGRPVGSKASDEGRIFVESQAMCAMAGVGFDDGKAERALDSVRSLLTTAHGILLLQPAYTRYRPELGEISSYPPGYKENGSVFCHTNAWVMIAEAMLGRGDAAFDYYRRTNPSAREGLSEVHRCEPYVYAQMIAGRDASTPGEAKNSWLTGSAAWHYVAVTQWILGVRPELDGLRVDPVIPASWPGFTMRRRWRGSTYEISVRNDRFAPGRVQALLVDGTEILGTLVPPAAPGATVKVEAFVEG